MPWRYVEFPRGGREQAYEADRTHRVAEIIRAADQERVDRELRNIHLALGLNATLDPFPFLDEGLRVAVRSGPLRGLAGIVRSRHHMDRLILQVQTLGQAVSLEIDGSVLDPI